MSNEVGREDDRGAGMMSDEVGREDDRGAGMMSDEVGREDDRGAGMVSDEVGREDDRGQQGWWARRLGPGLVVFDARSRHLGEAQLEGDPRWLGLGLGLGLGLAGTLARRSSKGIPAGNGLISFFILSISASASAAETLVGAPSAPCGTKSILEDALVCPVRPLYEMVSCLSETPCAMRSDMHALCQVISSQVISSQAVSSQAVSSQAVSSQAEAMLPAPRARRCRPARDGVRAGP
jgi:hypothetical protein